MNRFLLVSGSILLGLTVIPLAAQNFTSDARLVAMGGVGGHSNAAMRLAGDARDYHAVGIPLGLFQVLKNTDVFRPAKDDFNPLYAMELLANPLHYTAGRHLTGSGETLVRDLVNGRIKTDLNAYRGFAPKSQFDSKGLVSPKFGKTLWLGGDRNSVRHGVYLGAGPYLEMGTVVNVDPRLVDLFAATADTYSPNTNFSISNTTDGQAAAAFTMGYRAHIARLGMSDRDGVYLAANYNYLRGFRYDTAATTVRFDTDSRGLVTLAPTTTPIVVLHESSTTGNGFAIDLGTTIVVNHWDLNFSANGIANRINWKDGRAETFVMSSLVQGLDFRKTTLTSPFGERQIKLPVQYLAGVAYNTERWTASSEISRGLQDWEFRTGAEYRLLFTEFRGGLHYKNDDIQPTGGIGLNLTQRFGIDAAIFGTSANIERKRKAAFALSLRFGSGNY